MTNKNEHINVVVKTSNGQYMPVLDKEISIVNEINTEIHTPDTLFKYLQNVAINDVTKYGKKIWKKAIQYKDRMRITTMPTTENKRGIVLQYGSKKTLQDYGIKNGDMLVLKDLGPQIGYSTVFFWEYFGPMVVYPLFFFFPRLFYTDQIPQHCLAQKLACAYWCFHYAKRIYETFYVHKFSHGTMPITNLYKNCSYYWMFGATVSYFINHPLYTSPPDERVIISFIFAMLCQYLNYDSHVILTNLRKPGDVGYSIPKGGLFSFVTCANYTAEIYGWFFFNVGTQSLMGTVFMVVGALQMALWAKAKHKRLKTIFDGKDGKDKYPKRWIVLPPFL